MEILLKRPTKRQEAEDGFRVLVDRLWPRGKKKADLRLDAWTKDIAPSTELRKWFGHDPKRWLEFCERYKIELKNPEVRATITQTIRAAQKRTRSRWCTGQKTRSTMKRSYCNVSSSVSHPPNRVLQKHTRVAAKWQKRTCGQ